MNIADTLQTLGVILALIGSAITVYLNLRKAPVDRRSADIDASASAATAIKSYSDEVIRLRGELAEMRQEITKLRNERDENKRTMLEWQNGIERLMAQIVSLDHVPVWRPEVGSQK